MPRSRWVAACYIPWQVGPPKKMGWSLAPASCLQLPAAWAAGLHKKTPGGASGGRYKHLLPSFRACAPTAPWGLHTCLLHRARRTRGRALERGDH